MAKFIYTEEALDDLDDIAAFSFENWGRKQAKRYVADIRAACRRLALNPFLGQACDEVFPGLRRFAKGSHVIYYRKTHSGIAISRILHQRMLPLLHLPADLQ